MLRTLSISFSVIVFFSFLPVQAEETIDTADTITSPTSGTLPPPPPRPKEFRPGQGGVGPQGAPIRAQVQHERDLRQATVGERVETFKDMAGERRTLLEQQVRERHQAFGSTTVAWRAQITDAVKARVTARAEHVARLLDAMLARLLGIAERLDARLVTLGTEGVDTTSATTKLSEAYRALENAEVAIAEVKKGMEAGLETENPQESLANARTLAETAKEALRAAHLALTEVARALPQSANRSDQPTFNQE